MMVGKTDPNSAMTMARIPTCCNTCRSMAKPAWKRGNTSPTSPKMTNVPSGNRKASSSTQPRPRPCGPHTSIPTAICPTNGGGTRMMRPHSRSLASHSDKIFWYTVGNVDGDDVDSFSFPSLIIMLLLLLLSVRCRRGNVLPLCFLLLGQSIGRMLGHC
jgi:hypothetical protein